MLESVYHIPVLLKESIDALDIKPNGVYADATFGGGGHSAEILSRLTTGKLISFDRDIDAEKNIIKDKRFIFVRNNFRFMSNYLKFHNLGKIDGILADLGVSSHHFDSEERGFSFRFPEADLDMRMNKEADLSASKLVNTYSDRELIKVFRDYGDINNAGKLALLIVKNRNENKIKSIDDFLKIISPVIPKKDSNQYLAKVFQALRIEVNREPAALKHFLEQTSKIIKPGGRLVVISYHSLEDRMVKNYMKTGNVEGILEKDFYGQVIRPFDQLGSKPTVPSEDEIIRNGRSRSAKLRIAIKL